MNTSGPDEPGRLVHFAVRELTRGHEGGGVRVVAATRTGILELEARIASTEAEPSLVLRLGDCEGAGPGDVLRDLEEISTIADHETISISIENGPVVFVASALGAPPIAEYVAAVARALVALEPHTSEVLRMPDIREVTDTQLAHAERLAAIYSGDAYTSTWDRLVLTVGPDSEGFRQPNMFTGVGALVQTESPEFWLGSSSYTVTRLLATQYLTPTIRDLAVLDELNEGDELEVRAGDDNRVVVAAVVDD